MIIRNSTANQTNYLIDKMLDSQNTLYKTQQQAMEQKKILRPSDDPLGTSVVMRANKNLSNIESFYNNIQTLDGESSVLDSTYGQILDKLDRIYELTISGSNGTNASEGSMGAIYDEVVSLKEEIVRLANTQYNGNYIFSGSNTALPAYTLNEDGSVVYNGTPTVDTNGNSLGISESEYARKLEIAEGTFLSVNYPADAIFGFYDATTNPPSGQGLFKVLGDLEAAMNPADFDQDKVREQIDVLKNSMSHVSTYRTKNGVNQSRLELVKTTHEDNEILITQQKSNVQDLDVTEAYSNLMQQYYAYQASLQISSQMINTSLLDYI